MIMNANTCLPTPHWQDLPSSATKQYSVSFHRLCKAFPSSSAFPQAIRHSTAHLDLP